MSRHVSIEALGDEISADLRIYSGEIRERVDKAGAKAVKRLVQITRATAPRGKRSPHFADSIAAKTVKGQFGDRHIWYVKAPNYRLTHLLVHGHATTNGGRVAPNHFLERALDQVRPEYEREVEEAVRE